MQGLSPGTLILALTMMLATGALMAGSLRVTARRHW